MNSALVILNPRRIAECLSSYEALDVDRIYVTGFYEHEIVNQWHKVLSTGHDFYSVVSDDCIVTQKAVDAVTALLDEHPVVTGYCGLDSTSPLVNLSTKPLPAPLPSVDAYEFPTKAEVESHPNEAYPTHFAGMALTTMSREMWTEHPFCVTGYGLQSDYALSWELQQAGVPIVAAREGYIHHVKERWNFPDIALSKRLLVGEIEREVRVECVSVPS